MSDTTTGTNLTTPNLTTGPTLRERDRERRRRLFNGQERVPAGRTGWTPECLSDAEARAQTLPLSAYAWAGAGVALGCLAGYLWSRGSSNLNGALCLLLGLGAAVCLFAAWVIDHDWQGE